MRSTSADHALVAVEAAPPVVVVEQRRASVVSVKDAPSSRVRAEDGKEIDGGVLTNDPLCDAGVGRQEAHDVRRQALSHNAGERGRPASDLQIRRVGDRIQSPISPGCTDVDKCVRLDNSGWRAEEQTVGNGKDRAVGANPDCQRRRRGDREQRVPSQQAKTVNDVLPHVFEPEERPRLPVEFLGLLDATNRDGSRPPRVLRRHPTRFVRLLQQRKVCLDLTRQLSFRPPHAKQVQQAFGKSSHRVARPTTRRAAAC